MFDERFMLHRYKSTSFAGQACILMIAGLIAWNYFARDIFRADLAAIVVITAAVKVSFMIWYRLRD